MPSRVSERRASPGPTWFVPEICFEDELFSNISILRFFRLPKPVLKSADELRALQQSPGGKGATLFGLTKTLLFVRFPRGMKQWRSLSDDKVQFLGGPVRLELKIGVYVLDEYREKDWKKPVKIDACGDAMSAIIEHEMKHVLDEIEIIRSYKPGSANEEWPIRNYLRDREPMPCGYLKRNIPTEVPDFQGARLSLNKFEHSMYGPWNDVRQVFKAKHDQGRAQQEDELKILRALYACRD